MASGLLAASDAEGSDAPLTRTAAAGWQPEEDRGCEPPSRQVVVRGLLTALAAGVVLALVAARALDDPHPADANVGGGAVKLFGIHAISPFEAVKESFKPDARTVEGAFTGGECHFNGTERCPLSAMPRDKLTAVFPGAPTRCLFGDAPYFFYVIPGATDKLLLYFQGGGACWDSTTANLGLCVKAVAYEGMVGIFDREKEDNPFKDYTTVIVSYCTGDAHCGNVTRDWPSLHGGPAIQNGYTNAKTVVDWVQANMGNQTLDSLIITGSSAGALGTQVWARKLLKDFDYEKAAVISDSYAAIFPDGVQGALMQGFGLCATGLLGGALPILCQTQTIDVQQIFELAMRSYPRVAFANLDSKTDFVQIAFYEAVLRSRQPYSDLHTNPKKFSETLGTLYRRYNLYPNWVSFMVNDAQHMYMNNEVLYQATPVGNTVRSKNGVTGSMLRMTGNDLQGDNLRLVEWLGRFPVGPGSEVGSACVAVVPTLSPATTLAPTSSGFLSGLSAFKNRMSTAYNSVKARVKKTVGTAARSIAHTAGMDYCDYTQAHKVFHNPA